MPNAYVFSAFGDPSTESFTDLPEPTPGPSEVLIRVHAASVNPVDWKIRAGQLGTGDPLPRALGSEGSGVVQATGEDVEGIGEGDEVFGATATGFGSLAQYTVLDGTLTARKPPQLGHVEASTIPVAGATAYDAIAQLGLTSGQTLLIVGVGGGVGVMAAQLARDAGVAVFGTASADKRELVEALGAVHVDHSADPVARMRELLPGGVDAILDLVGGDALREVAVLVKQPGGIVSAADFGVDELGGAVVARSQNRETLTAVAELMVAGKLDPHVTETYPFEQTPEAMRSVESGHNRGKTVVDLTQTTEV